MTYSIRRMQEGDLEQVREIDMDAFPSQWPVPNYRQELSNKLAYYIVLSDDDRSVELTSPTPLWHDSSFLERLLPWRKPQRIKERSVRPTSEYLVGFSGIWLLVNEAHITNIAVRSSYRGRGLGDYLLIATYDLARELHATVMTLEVRVTNAVAQQLYAKFGFEEKGRRKGYYLDNREDALIMTVENIDSEAYEQKIEELRTAVTVRLK